MDVREKLVEICFYEFCEVAGDSPCGCDCCPYGEYGSENGECYEAYKKDKLDKLEKSGVTVQEWVKVEDRFPEKCGRYLTANRTKKGHVVNVYDLWFEDSKWYVDECDDLYEGEVTHWMPLPQPPKGD